MIHEVASCAMGSRLGGEVGTVATGRRDGGQQALQAIACCGDVGRRGLCRLDDGICIAEVHEAESQVVRW